MSRKSESLTEKTANAIVAMIVKEHRFSPGDKIPNEMELSEELNVSRITLREAIRILCTRGMLEVRRGRGTFVISDNPEAMSGLGKLSVESDCSRRELLQLRLALEPMAAGNAAKRAGERELRELEGMLRRMEDLQENGQPIQKEEEAFHGAVVRAGGNRAAAQIAVRCPSCAEISYGLSSGEDAAGVVRELRELVQCLRERDRGGARAAMRLHLLRSFQSEGIE